MCAGRKDEGGEKGEGGLQGFPCVQDKAGDEYVKREELTGGS